MKKIISISVVFIMLCSSLDAASIIFYSKREKGKVRFKTLPAKYIAEGTYDEEDKILKLMATHNNYEFKVQTAEEARNIMKRICVLVD